MIPNMQLQIDLSKLVLAAEYFSAIAIPQLHV